jgi:hypothetical protein
VVWLCWTALRGYRTSRLAAVLFLFQALVVAWKFRFEFRFLGGLEYIAVIVMALTLAKEGSDPAADNANHGPPEWGVWGRRLERSRNWILLGIGVPWLGAQIVYARPFAEVVSGWTPRNQFLERYVALSRDFAALDGMLPKNAVLYLPDGRPPNFYAPRPVVLTVLDLRGREPVYRLTLEPTPAVEAIEGQSILSCGATVYSNDDAIVVAYRTPGRKPMVGRVDVQKCEIDRRRRDTMPEK